MKNSIKASIFMPSRAGGKSSLKAWPLCSASISGMYFQGYSKAVQAAIFLMRKVSSDFLMSNVEFRDGN